MKLKSFAMLAMSGLLAGSIAYIAPAMADYTNTNSQANQPGDAQPNQNYQDPNTNVGAMPSNTQNNSANANNSNNTDYNVPPSNEQGSPDTATGDDDY